MTSTIKRLENLKDPDREVDAEIAKAIGWRDFISDKVPAYYWIDEENRPRLEVPYFTGSIDAARSICKDAFPTLICTVYRKQMVRLIKQSDQPSFEYTGIGKTIELAWCIAALRARGVK